MKILKNIIKILTVSALFFTAALSYAEEYSRNKFPTWEDFDNDGEDAREEVLIEEMYNCDKATWVCPYTGRVITDSSQIDIDHVVPLKWGWEHGASEWSLDKRIAFANDPDNLLAVYYAANRSKGSRGPTIWLPPNFNYCKEYITKFRVVCEKYGLKFDLKAFEEVYEFCDTMDKGFRLDKIGE